jgi:hypothetical protein
MMGVNVADKDIVVFLSFQVASGVNQLVSRVGVCRDLLKLFKELLLNLPIHSLSPDLSGAAR